VDFMNSSEFFWAYCLTVGPIVFCIALYCYMADRARKARAAR